MLECSKKPYANRWAAERALQAIRESCRSRDRRAPTGSYWCGLCKAWHLTSKSKSRTPSWFRNRRPQAERGINRP